MHLIKSANAWNDRIAKNLIKLQVKDGRMADRGGILSPEKGFAEPAMSARAADVFLAAYYSPQSTYHQKDDMLEAAKRCAEHLLSSLNEDGTLDLLETNYHDATCNAFCVQVIAYTYRMMKQYSRHSETEEYVFSMLHDFLERSAGAMVTGGFHTPNHRWVLASALVLCYRELGLEECRQAAFEYLDEGIDCDEEGEYTEHSVGIYDVACNQSLLIILREMGMPELIEPVLRNLNKLSYYIEPDGSVVTLNSRRQDFGKKMYPDPQLLNCLYVLAAAHDAKDERFMQAAGLAEFLYRSYEEHGHALILPHDAGHFVTQFLLYPKLAELNHPALPVRSEYRKNFERAGVARVRKGDMALTLLRGRPIFLKLQVGGIELMLRAGACFYACGQLISPTVEEIENGYRLRCQSEGDYVRPLGKQAGTTDWASIPHEKRRHVNGLTLEWVLDVLVFDCKVELLLRIGGCENLPWKLEGILTPGGMLKADGCHIPAGEGSYAIIAKGFEYSCAGGTLRWEGGLNQHTYAPNMRNTPANEQKAFTVYNTGFAPFSHAVTLSWPRAEGKPWA